LFANVAWNSFVRKFTIVWKILTKILEGQNMIWKSGRHFARKDKKKSGSSHEKNFARKKCNLKS
jgi:hypothetical protein